MKKLFIVALAIATALSVTVPVQAFPLVKVQQAQTSDVEQVRDQIIRKNNWRGNQNRSDRDWNHQSRNDRDHRNYRRHDNSNAGAIIGGLAAGAILGSVLSSQNGDNSGNCASRYRSYRASDNTYQPFNGPRQQCR